MDLNQIGISLRKHLEPHSTIEAPHCAVEVLDASYAMTDLSNIVNGNCKHLNLYQLWKLLKLLSLYEEVFNRKLGLGDRRLAGNQKTSSRGVPQNHKTSQTSNRKTGWKK